MLFVYKGIDRSGRKVSGEIVASSEKDAVRILKNKGIFVTSLRKKFFDLSMLVPITAKDWAYIFGSLRILLSSDFPPVSALDLLIEEQYSPKVTTFLIKVKEVVSQGFPLWKGLKEAGAPHQAVVLVRQGEETGSLPEVLKSLEMYYKKIADFTDSIKPMLVMPAITLIVAIITSVFMFIFLIPKLKRFYDYAGIPLPLLTRMELYVYENKFYFLVGGLILLTASVLLFKRTYKTNKAFKKAVDAFLLKTPIVKTVLIVSSSYKSLLLLKVLMDAGVPITVAVKNIYELQTNEVLREEWQKVYRNLVEARMDFGTALSLNAFVSPITRGLLRVGSETGMITEVLSQSVFHEEERFKVTVEFLKKLVEPIMIIFIAFVVGTILIGAYMPLANISTLINKMVH